MKEMVKDPNTCKDFMVTDCNKVIQTRIVHKNVNEIRMESIEFCKTVQKKHCEILKVVKENCSEEFFQEPI